MTTINHEAYCGQDLIELLLKAGFDWQDYFVAHSIDEHFHWEIPLHIAQRWLREVKGKEVEIEVFPDELVGTTWGFHLYDLGACDSIVFQNPYTYNTFEEAQEAGEKKALEIILEKGGQHDS